MYEFSFDEWACLYRDDPAEFERRRTEVLTQEILRAPVEHRDKLRLLQLQCDVIRSTNDPLQAVQEMLNMSLKKLNELKTPLTQLRAVCEDIVHPE